MISEESLKQAARCIRTGGIILYPTETVYGLGGDPTRPDVVERIRRIKQRTERKPMLVLTDHWERVHGWITNVTPLHRKLMQRSPPEPITILFDSHADELAEVRAGSSKIGIRCTGNEFCGRLIRAADTPIISTSANVSGAQPPGTLEAVEAPIIDAVDWYGDAGQPLRGRPSTVVAVEDGELRVLREGAVSRQEIEQML